MCPYDRLTSISLSDTTGVLLAAQTVDDTRHPSVDGPPSVPRVLDRSTPGGSPLALRPRWREVTALRARAARSGTDALRAATLNRRTTSTWNFSSPSGPASYRRHSCCPPNVRKSSMSAATNGAAARWPSRRTASRRKPISGAWIVVLDPASGGERFSSPRAATSCSRRPPDYFPDTTTWPRAASETGYRRGAAWVPVELSRLGGGVHRNPARGL